MAMKPAHTTVRIDRIVVESRGDFDAATFEAGVRDELRRLIASEGVDARAASRRRFDAGAIDTRDGSAAVLGRRVARAAHAALRRTE